MKLKKPLRFLAFILVCCFSVFVIVLGINIIITACTPKVKDIVIMEAGTSVPSVNDFLSDEKQSAVLLTDISGINANTPGLYDIEILIGKIKHKSKLEIKDTTPPECSIKELDIYDGETAEAADFIESVSDVSDVEVSYKSVPDFSKINSQPVTIVLKDASDNISECNTVLRVSKLKNSIKLEASQEHLNIRELLKKPGQETGNVSLIGDSIRLNKVGVFPVRVSIDGAVYDSVVEIEDTVPPAGHAVDRSTWLGEPIDASAFIEKSDDITHLTVSYVKEPDFNIEGEQKVSLILADEGGNKTTLDAVLTILKDHEPPKIYGAKRLTAYIGQPVSYKKGVYAEDNKDGKLSVNVDSSKVNLKVEGDYKVLYTASDSSGNTAAQEVTITVKKQVIDMQELNRLADEVLAQITTEDMTLREKAWEIYQYVNTHVKYNGMSDKTDWMKEAYYGITKGVGDCFTYYSVSNLLLSRIGMQTLSVERASKPGEAKHYWHMVNYGEGWYHFDACIHKPPLVSFMLTDAELDAYSKRVGKDNYYYRYDRENYPATPEK